MIPVDEDELWFLFQAADFSVNIASFEQGTQDLLADMQEEALGLVLDLLGEEGTP